MKMMAIPQHGPRHKLTKLHNYRHKMPRRFTQADKNNNKPRTLMIKLVMYSKISPPFNLFPDLSCSIVYCGCTLQICRSDPKCVTSHWQWWIGHRQTHEMAPGVNQEIEFFFFLFLDKVSAYHLFLPKQNYPCYDERLFQDVNWMPWLSAQKAKLVL